MSISTEMVGHCMVFRGENADPLCDQTVLVEVTARYDDGTIELAFTADKQRREYLRVPLKELVRIAARTPEQEAPQ